MTEEKTVVRMRLLSGTPELVPEGRVHIKEEDREGGYQLCRKSRLWWDKGQGPTVTAFQVLWTWWPAVLPHKTPPGSAQRTLGSQGDRASMACQSSPGEVRMLIGSARM